MADRSGYIGRAPGDSSVQIARQTFNPTGIQTTFVFTSGYDVGYLDVFLNGTKLVNATDYQATDTQNVILTTAAQNGDILEFVAYKAFNLTTVFGQAADLSVSGTLNVNGATTLTGGVTGGLDVSDGLDVTGTITQNGIGVATVFGDGSAMAGIVTTIVAGPNITVDQPNQTVTISGIGTADINADRAVVAGVTTSNEYDGYLYLDTSLF